MLTLLCSFIFANNEITNLPNSVVKFLYDPKNKLASAIYKELKEQILKLGPEENFKIWGPSDLEEYKVTELEIKREFGKKNYDTIVLLINADFIAREYLQDLTETFLEQTSTKKIIIIINECLWTYWKKLFSHLQSDRTIILSDLSQTALYDQYKKNFQNKETTEEIKKEYINYAARIIIKELQDKTTLNDES